ncbi:MFS transporter [Nonomuraea thailandensis]
MVEASGNRLAGRFYATLGDRQRRMSIFALRLRPERLPCWRPSTRPSSAISATATTPPSPRPCSATSRPRTARPAEPRSPSPTDESPAPTMLHTSQAAPVPAAGSRPNAWRGVAAAMFACGWGGNQFTPLLLMYRQQGGYSALSVDAFLGAYVVGLVPGLLLAGPVSDRRGRRPVLVAGTVASALASLVLCFGGQGAWPIYAGRLIAGFAVGIAMAVGTSWVKELSEEATAGCRRAAPRSARRRGSGSEPEWRARWRSGGRRPW